MSPNQSKEEKRLSNQIILQDMHIEATTLQHLSQTSFTPNSSQRPSLESTKIFPFHDHNNQSALHTVNDDDDDYNDKIHCLQYHKDTVLCVAKCRLLDNSKQKLIEYIFSGSQDSSIGVWDTDTFQLKGQLLGHSRSILNLYVIDDSIMNPLLLSTSRDNCICIWDIRTLSLLFRITNLPSLVYDFEVLSFPNNGGYYLFGGCQDTNIFTLCLSILPYLMKLQFEKLRIQYRHQKQIQEFEQTSSLIGMLKSKRTTSEVIDIGKKHLNELKKLLLLQNPSILSPSGFKQRWIDPNVLNAVSDNDDDDQFSTTQTQKKECRSPSKMIKNFKLPKNTNDIRDIIKTDPTVQFLSSSIDEIMEIYEEIKECLCDNEEDEGAFVLHRVFNGCHHGFIYVMKQMSNDYVIITGSSDATIKIWEVEMGGQKLNCLSVLIGHSHSVIDFDLMGNEYLITASRDCTLRIWNIASIHKPHTRHTINGHDEELTAVKVIGNLIVSAARNGSVIFWNGKNFEILKRYKLEETKRMNSIHFDGNIHKEWTETYFEENEQNKAICVMSFEFMEPSWLLLSDTAFEVQIWDISHIMKLTAAPNTDPFDKCLSVTNDKLLVPSSPKKEVSDSWNDIESVLNGLEVKNQKKWILAHYSVLQTVI